MPYRIVVETDGDDQAIVCRVDRIPDPEWALALAEVAYQARSALDQLVKQLFIDSGNAHQRGTAFPIFTNSDSYMKPDKRGVVKRDTLLEGVASRHRRVIDDVQPYRTNGAEGLRMTPLAVLSTVSNRDKHNDVYTAIAAVGINTANLAPHAQLHLEVLEMNVELGFVSDRVVTLAQIDQAVLRVSAVIDRCAIRLKP